MLNASALFFSFTMFATFLDTLIPGTVDKRNSENHCNKSGVRGILQLYLSIV